MQNNQASSIQIQIYITYIYMICYIGMMISHIPVKALAWDHQAQEGLSF